MIEKRLSRDVAQNVTLLIHEFRGWTWDEAMAMDHQPEKEEACARLISYCLDHNVPSEHLRKRLVTLGHSPETAEQLVAPLLAREQHE